MVQLFRGGGGGGRVQLAIPIETLSFFLPLRLNPVGHQTGIQEYQVLRGLVETK